ncbi:MAG: (2Fe-2S)-binding protein [Desulfurococcaceae archaeon]
MTEYRDYIIKLTVNGVTHVVSVKPYERLIDVLRYKLGLTSVKEGCGRGECGACVVILNGKIIPSCLTLAIRANEAEVQTLEGLAPEGKLHAVQKALIEVHGIQCGFCIPGFAIAIKHLVDNNPNPTDEEIKEALDGYLCRCGSYPMLIEAAKLAAKYVSEGRKYFDLRECLGERL